MMNRLLLLAAYFAFMNFHGVVSAPAPANAYQSNPASFVAPLLAQEGEHAAAGEPAAEGEAHGEEHSLLHDIFHYANFLVLAGALIYLIKKMLVPFLNERGRLIREDMQKSSEAIEQANARLKAMEDRMGNLDRELAQLREAGMNEAKAERARIEKEAEAEATKILAAANMEMDSAVKAARQDLQAFASQLALNVAEKKIKDGLTPQADKQIVSAFLTRLGSDGDAAGRKN